MQRLCQDHVFTEDESPVIIPHGSYVGLGIFITSATSTVTVSVSASLNGSFTDEVTMLGSNDFLYPDTDGMNMLYNARYVKIEWDAGDIQVSQKS